MRLLPQPSVSAADAFEACTAGIQAPDKKRLFDAVADEVAQADILYREKAEIGAFADLEAKDFALPGVEMTWLYEVRMVQASPGRRIYDSIRGATRKCPLCGEGQVSTVDHHLPKSSHNALAVNPVNLVPACADCNKKKLDKIVSTLHPYFDDIQDRWLRAKVIEKPPCEPPDTDFFVDPPTDWPTQLADRVRKHFEVFGLADLFQIHAGTMLSGQQLMFAREYERGQAVRLREYLLEQAESWQAHNANCWQAALFEALAANDWYCSGGFRF